MLLQRNRTSDIFLFRLGLWSLRLLRIPVSPRFITPYHLFWLFERRIWKIYSLIVNLAHLRIIVGYEEFPIVDFNAIFRNFIENLVDFVESVVHIRIQFLRNISVSVIIWSHGLKSAAQGLSTSVARIRPWPQFDQDFLIFVFYWNRLDIWHYMIELNGVADFPFSDILLLDFLVSRALIVWIKRALGFM